MSNTSAGLLRFSRAAMPCRRGDSNETIDSQRRQLSRLPEDKFNSAPPESADDFKGVRCFAGQVKHVTGSSYYFFGGTSMTQ